MVKIIFGFRIPLFLSIANAANFSWTRLKAENPLELLKTYSHPRRRAWRGSKWGHQWRCLAK